MVNRKQKKKKVGDWHHRVPDFQLVYCGPKKKIMKEENIGKPIIDIYKTNVDLNKRVN